MLPLIARDITVLVVIVRGLEEIMRLLEIFQSWDVLFLLSRSRRSNCCRTPSRELVEYLEGLAGGLVVGAGYDF